MTKHSNMNDCCEIFIAVTSVCLFLSKVDIQLNFFLGDFYLNKIFFNHKIHFFYPILIKWFEFEPRNLIFSCSHNDHFYQNCRNHIIIGNDTTTGRATVPTFWVSSVQLVYVARFKSYVI